MLQFWIAQMLKDNLYRFEGVENMKHHGRKFPSFAVFEPQLDWMGDPPLLLKIESVWLGSIILKGYMIAEYRLQFGGTVYKKHLVPQIYLYVYVCPVHFRK